MNEPRDAASERQSASPMPEVEEAVQAERRRIAAWLAHRGLAGVARVIRDGSYRRRV